MPESPEDFHARVSDSLGMPPVDDWDTFPFEGDMRPRTLRGPMAQEKARRGAGGIDCMACQAPDSDYLWTTERWRVRSLDKPAGLPVIVFLEPRAHYGDPGDLPDELASELGRMLAKIERAVRGIPDVGRVHVCRWGDGTEHLHWWFMARPARIAQLSGSFAAIWDDVLPPTPQKIWDENLTLIVRALGSPPPA